MRLINTTTLALEEFHGDRIPVYAILSHTWGDDEVTFQHFTTLPAAELAARRGFAKIRHTCRLARKSAIDWAWVDTCCIDKSSSAELTEAINSMFRWYAGARACYAYLADLEADAKEGGGGGFAHCRWFGRGWTLQELIAPRRLGFYNRDWEFQGEKTGLSAVLAEITGIGAGVLDDAGLLGTVPVAQRMSWAAGRQTTRAEDLAYCLVGIFGVNMPLLYGEGDRAFLRLQEEIIKESNDLTLFAWHAAPGAASAQKHWGILAPSARAFADCADIETWVDPMHNNECAMTSKGLRVTPVPGGGLRLGGDGAYVMNLQCHRRDRLENLGILLQQHGCDVYTRVRADTMSTAPRSSRDKYRMFYVLKTVSPARAVVLGTSHRRAIDLSRALASLAGLDIRLASLQPEGHWDGQRSLFLTRGTRNFNCQVRLEMRGPRGALCRMVMECRLAEDGLSVTLADEDEQNTEEHMLAAGFPKPHVSASPNQAAAARWSPTRWLAVRAVQDFVNGQPVYFVVVEKTGKK
ncbi:HET-domain-containing protein [Trichocladium antarcticum]|uniref:HET-domain-containing protein n=1 Tax=Trichocladium antarcticum TaxID=1450529 RepID=A0AAN6UFA4_9PEZI|nr:HET-domain-containing protein [Trichocladium antarcticum]